MKFQFKIYSCLIVSLLFFGWRYSLPDQEKLLVTVSKEEVRLNSEQSERMAKIQKGEFTKNSVFVKTGDLRSIQREGSIIVNIPILGINRTFNITYVDNHDDGGYSWAGSSISNGMEDGKLNIHYMNEKVFGTIEAEDRFFRLIDLSDDLWAFVEIEEDITGEVCNAALCGNSDKKADKTVSKIKAVKSGNTGVCGVDVLVLYTEKAKDDEPDMTQLANNCIQESNEILVNSAVNSCDLRFNLIGLQEISLNEGYSLVEDLYISVMGYADHYDDWITNPQPDVTEANSLREQYNADIVIVFTGKKYCDGSKRVYGTAGQAITLNNPSLAFGIVDVNYALGKRKAFVHEAGHIFDLWHENEPDYSGRGYQFNAGGLFNSKKRTTIMHLENAKKRISYFSNPDVEFEGENTGSYTPLINSAQRLRETGCTVADYRQTPAPPLSAGIRYEPSSSPHVAPGGIKTYFAEVSYGEAPFQYEWRVSSDGFNFGNVLSSTNQLVRNYTGYLHGEELFIKLKVTDSNAMEDEVIFVQIVYEEGGAE